MVEYIMLLTLGKISHKSPTLVRVQTANVLTDALGMTSESKSTNMIKRSLAMIRDNGSGALLYMESKKEVLMKNLQNHLHQQTI